MGFDSSEENLLSYFQNAFFSKFFGDIMSQIIRWHADEKINIFLNFSLVKILNIHFLFHFRSVYIWTLMKFSKSFLDPRFWLEELKLFRIWFYLQWVHLWTDWIQTSLCVKSGPTLVSQYWMTTVLLNPKCHMLMINETTFMVLCA